MPQPRRHMTDMAMPTKGDLDSVAQEVNFDGLWGFLWTFPKRKPFATNLVLSTSVAVLGDYTVQKMEGRKWDKRRSCLFFALGLFNGAALWFVYITVFSRLFPNAIRFANKSFAQKCRDLQGQLDVMKQSFCDLLVYAPTLAFPVFYLFKANIQEGGSFDECTAHAWFYYRQNVLEDMARNCMCWVPGNIICFSAPAWLRLPLTHAGCYGWNMIMSWTRASPSGEGE
eukprot:CAMPEP_0179137328 /NCGR_PEP_ID=MMETSP0796-20121207/65505_1 /TAXON_ID=73915 /ORGANISM="Pyrodinium bahamense, Strain pbaha01" /LENGTH=226 /DNA_ID=CAMNT_0020836499 /DNA_START=21 /DNA_END=701 /DNA_ORIENTATION=+